MIMIDNDKEFDFKVLCKDYLTQIISLLWQNPLKFSQLCVFLSNTNKPPPKMCACSLSYNETSTIEIAKI